MNHQLSPREQLCLYWAAQGKTSWEIGVILDLSESTVNFHITNSCRKLGVNRRQAAITKAIQCGCLQRDVPTSARRSQASLHHRTRLLKNEKTTKPRATQHPPHQVKHPTNRPSQIQYRSGRVKSPDRIVNSPPARRTSS